jgi:hypothetical protein
MRKILALLLFLGAGTALAQTNTPTPSNTPTPTYTPSNTPTFTPTYTPTPRSLVEIGSGLNLIVPSGATDTNEALLGETQLWGLTIFSPATIDGTVTVQVAPSSGGTFVTLQVIAGTDLALAASKGVSFQAVAGKIRVHESSSAAAARTFVIVGARVTR